MTQPILPEILDWSADRPAWQRDALRRIIQSGELAEADHIELVEICKASHGLIPPKTAQVLEKKHLPAPGAVGGPVTLESLTHLRGVNALAEQQTVSFGPNLTVVYGPNAAGKSGYTRILKRACRARASEKILGNVLRGGAPVNPEATIKYRKGGVEAAFGWKDDDSHCDALGAVSIFDAQCAPVYLRDKTDVAFRPLGLDVFDKLSAACVDLRERLDREVALLKAQRPAFPVMPEGTRPHALLAQLTSLTNPQAVKDMASLSDGDRRRLDDLRQRQRDLLASNPKQRAHELELKATRLETVLKQFETISTVLSADSVARLRAAHDALRAAEAALEELRLSTLSKDLLPTTGGDPWRRLWAAAAEFTAVACPGVSFPSVGPDSRCPVCQQTIGEAAATRLKHLQEFATSKAREGVTQSEGVLAQALRPVKQLTIPQENVEPGLVELAGEDEPLAKSCRVFLQEADRLRAELVDAVPKKADIPIGGCPDSPADQIRARVQSIRDRAVELSRGSTSLDPAAAKDLAELEARDLLHTNLQSVLDEIERQKRLAAYALCLGDVSTAPITRKGSDLTKQHVTDKLRAQFAAELKGLEFTHVALEIQPAGGARGALFHKIVFTRAPGAELPDILSEGESRTLSLAAFMTELSTASNPSAIIFDDPVSSLDHVWRERIARRLVTEARTRQVIVFSHDLMFLRALMAECEQQGVARHDQYVRRTDTSSGLCSPELPWQAMAVKDRLGKLNALWQAADAVHRKEGAAAFEDPASTIYGLLREAWEQAVAEVLLGDVVQRYRHSIETQKLKKLHDITEEDCRAVEAGMSECSRWMKGHDRPPGDGTPFPSPDELKRRITDLADWAKAIRKRRE